MVAPSGHLALESLISDKHLIAFDISSRGAEWFGKYELVLLVHVITPERDGRCQCAKTLTEIGPCHVTILSARGIRVRGAVQRLGIRLALVLLHDGGVGGGLRYQVTATVGDA